jgi:hypothetical protein
MGLTSSVEQQILTEKTNTVNLVTVSTTTEEIPEETPEEPKDNPTEE